MTGENAGFWAWTWRRLRARRGARLGIRVLISGFSIAAFAPFFANGVPLTASMDGVRTWPLLQTLGPADAIWFGAGVALLLVWFARRRWAWYAAGACILVSVSVAPSFEPSNLAVVDYRSLEADGSNTMLWPPVAWSPDDLDRSHSLHPPFSGGGHPLGTDALGRDVAARILFGARTSLLVGIVAAGTAALIGLLLGALAGWYGGRVDALLSWSFQVVMCFPVLVLVLTLCVFIEPSLLWVMLIIGLATWPGPARLVRGEVLRLRSLPFVEAGRALGVPELRLLFRHVIPNALTPLIVNATLGVAGAIVLESTLSFLGLGTGDGISWGTLLRDGRAALPDGGHLVLFPGLCVFGCVMAWNLVGEGLQDATDPGEWEDSP